VIALAALSMSLASADLAAQRSTSEVRARMISISNDSVPLMVGGQVLSIEDGDVIPGAQVFFAWSSVGTLTDSDGMFRLDAPSPGPVELRVRLIGYLEACVRLDLVAGTMRSLRIDLPRAPGLTPPSPEGFGSGCIDPETESPR